MFRIAFLMTTTVFWVSMMSQLIHKEFFELTPIEAPYEVLPLHNLSLREEYRAIYLGKELVGFNFNVLETASGEEGPSFELRHQSYLSFLFLGEEREMFVKGKAALDPQLNLESFDVRISSGDYWTEISGQIAKDNLNVVVEGKEGQPTRNIIPIKRPLIFSEALTLIWTPDNLKLGKKGKLQVWNPLMMGFEDITFEVRSKEKITYQGRDVEVFVVALDQGGIITRSWVSPEGVVLRQESPTGLIMEKQEAWKIFDTMRNSRANLIDLPNLYSIPSNRILDKPEKLKRMRIKMTLPDSEKVIDLKRDNMNGLEKATWPIESDIESFAPYLEATRWIQSNDPVIFAKAREIVGGERSALEASLRIMRWVHQYVSPIPTVSLPSALQVLAVKKGDCNEYTALFTALTRSLGIPTKMVAGVVYQQGRFFYHAWPEVYLGRWVGLDPTFGQAPVDVTHLSIIEGDLEKQVELVKKIGQIKLAILETE